eukprot:6466624-Amphidinium_carterae.1
MGCHYGHLAKPPGRASHATLLAVLDLSCGSGQGIPLVARGEAGKSTAQRALKLHAIAPRDMHFLTFSDAGGMLNKDSGLLDRAGQAQDTTQGAWIIIATSCISNPLQPVRLTPLMWKNANLKRKQLTLTGRLESELREPYTMTVSLSTKRFLAKGGRCESSGQESSLRPEYYTRINYTFLSTTPLGAPWRDACRPPHESQSRLSQHSTGAHIIHWSVPFYIIR